MVLAASSRMPFRIMLAVVAVLAVSCGNGDGGPRITVGSGDSAESIVLAQIYANALARTGIHTAVRPDLGDRAAYLAALDANRVQLVGEHTGALLDYFDAGVRTRAGAESPDGAPKPVADAVNGALPEGLVVSDPADGADLRARVLRTEAAVSADGLRSVADFAPHCAESTVGVVATPELIAQPVALASDSGCRFAVTERFSDLDALRKALLDGRIQAGLVSAPRAELTSGLVVLADDDYAVPAENVLALMRKGALDDVRAKKVNYVAGELTTDELTEMIRRVVDEGADPGAVANAWLDEHAL